MMTATGARIPAGLIAPRASKRQAAPPRGLRAAADEAGGGLAGRADGLGRAHDRALHALTARARAPAPPAITRASPRASAGATAATRARPQAPLPPYRTLLGASGARIL